MALNFPNNPSAGDSFTAPDGIEWEWTGTRWMLVGGGGSDGYTFMQDTVPVATEDGQTWFDTSTGDSFVWYEDGDSGQWVQSAPGAPPSAAIESGNNGDSFWVKYPDGTLLQYGRPSIPFNQIGTLNELALTFPIPFVDIPSFGGGPSITVSVNGSGQNWNAWTGGDSNTGCMIYISRIGLDGTSSRRCAWQALGRWK